MCSFLSWGNLQEEIQEIFLLEGSKPSSGEGGGS